MRYIFLHCCRMKVDVFVNTSLFLHFCTLCAIFQSIDAILDAAVHANDGINDEDAVVNMSPKSLTKYRLSNASRRQDSGFSATSDTDNHILNEMHSMKERHKEAQLEVDKYKRNLEDKQREIDGVKEEILKSEATRRKLSEKLEHGKYFSSPMRVLKSLIKKCYVYFTTDYIYDCFQCHQIK